MTWNVQLGGTARSPQDVESLHALGLDFAEVPIIRPDQFETHMGAFAALREETGLFYLCHGPREGDPNDIPALKSLYLPRLLQVLSLMPRLEMNLLTLHLWVDPRFVRPDAIQCKIEILDALIERAEPMGVAVCLENLSETHGHLSEIFRSLPLLNLTLDLGHGQLLTSENTSHGLIKTFPERIRHIHLHDNRGGNSPQDDLHLPVGQGTIRFSPIMIALQEMGYERTMTLELRPKEIGACLDYVRRLLGDC